MKRILLSICISIAVLLSYSRQYQDCRRCDNFIVIKDVSVDSLTNLLKEAFSTVNKSNHYKISVTPTTEEISPVNSRTERNFIKRNIERYVSGDTLIINIKDSTLVKNYLFYRVNFALASLMRCIASRMVSSAVA